MRDEIGSRSESKSTVGEKRTSAQLGEKSERCKRVKMRDLDSVCRSEEMIEASRHFSSLEKEKPQEVLKDAATAYSDIAQAEITASKRLPSTDDLVGGSLDLNTEACLDKNSSGGNILPPADKLSSVENHGVDADISLTTSKGFGWDLNEDDSSNSLSQDPFFRYKNREHLKPGDASECGSTTGPLEDKDPMRKWKEMKQNGFLSSSHGGITVPNKRGRKSKSDGLKKKMELAKREQVDRFAKIAAPSGLLNELNPGIINHVRNRKQVHSIIEALVRSEKHENHRIVGKQTVSARICSKDDNVNGFVMNHLGVSHDGSLGTLSMSQQIKDCATLSGSLHVSSDQSGRDGNSINVERRVFDKISCPSQAKHETEDDGLALKLSSLTTMASEDISSLSNEESVNLSTVSSLSVKAANVAFQWLELLHQDIKGRLAALRRSKKRVRSVINTELPFLLKREFSCSQENDPHVVKNLGAGCSENENADLHQARWNALFDQMDKALSEEEKQLEIWSNQVKEMQLQCEKGLQDFHYNAFNASQRPGTLENDYRFQEMDKSERDLAVRAAAASIYSTCNFMLSAENVPCV